MSPSQSTSADYFALLAKEFTRYEDELNQLDAAIGDGDHGATLLKGLHALVNAPGAPAGKTFRKAAGGASGSLFAQVMSAFETVLDENAPLGDALNRAARQISQLGQAKPGDKTFLDALLPAAAAAQAEPGNATSAAAKAARAGMEATREMAAKRGRARYVEGAGIGHLDAGAVSLSRMLDLFERFVNIRGDEAAE